MLPEGTRNGGDIMFSLVIRMVELGSKLWRRA